ncbi:unnamed protein product, partial [marine sediment metagenome]
MDKSEYCWDNRVTENFALHDATVTPWPFANKEFDLCVGIGSLKHIPEDKVDSVLREIGRVSERSLFCLGTGIFSPPELKDIVLNKTLEWWQDLFGTTIPNHSLELLSIEMERETRLAFHLENEIPKRPTIIENLQSMVFNPDGSSK